MLFDNKKHTHIMPILTEFKISEHDSDGDLNYNFDAMPILTLRNMVMFPAITMPVAVGRKKSLQLVHDAQKNNQAIGVVCQIDGDVEDPKGNDIYKTGVVAEIIKILELPDESVNVILQAKMPFQINEVVATKPYILAKGKPYRETVPKSNDEEYKALALSISEITRSILSNMEENGRELMFAIKNIDNPNYLINFLASNLPFDVEQKQQLLEEHNLKLRGHKLFAILSHENKLLEIKADIQSKTREDLSQQQREHFLQQQIRTIQEELGNTDDDDFVALQARAAKKKWSEEVANAFNSELRKLQRLNPQSPDYAVLYSHLDNMLNLPWNEYTTDNFNLTRVEKKLNADHYGLEKVKDRILEHLAVLKLRGDMKAPILCLYGPPGVGKTSLGRSVADALKRKYARVSLGGLHDEAEIRGHRRTYIGAMPGRILDALIRCGSSNPVFVLDEIDKIGNDFKGDPASALLEVLDPEQNSHFHDNYIDIDYDLSKILFIATANSLATISQPLLDRMEIIEINGYIQEEKVEIAKRHLLPKQLEENGFEPKEVSFTKDALNRLIESYTRESGVRELDKKIAKVLRKLARKKAVNEPFKHKIDADNLASLIGPDDYTRDKYEGNEFAGVVTGLAWTAVGGEILFVESSLSKGKGEKLTLTGNLGDVMKESAVIALQYLRAHSHLFGIDYELFDKYNVHIHVPEGAIPKDGPSAGITMVTSLASSFTQLRVRDHLAMTGEITLRGKVLPVGGIKEKILAAKRAGITDIILCQENKKDIDEIKETYLSGLTFHFVNTIKEVIDIALLPDKVKDAIEL